SRLFFSRTVRRSFAFRHFVSSLSRLVGGTFYCGGRSLFSSFSGSHGFVRGLFSFVTSVFGGFFSGLFAGAGIGLVAGGGLHIESGGVLLLGNSGSSCVLMLLAFVAGGFAGLFLIHELFRQSFHFFFANFVFILGGGIMAVGRSHAAAGA